MIGLEERDHNGIRVVRLHYTADPDKRSDEWRARAQQGMSKRDWEREYEINWSIASGLPVYAEEFIREFHVAKSDLLWDVTRPITRGWDFGLQPACVWTQIDAQGRCNVLHEHVTWRGRGEMAQKDISVFAPEVVLISSDLFPNAEFKDYADPAGWQKAQTDSKSCADIMRTLGMHPVPGPVTWQARKSAMTKLLQQQTGGVAKLLIDPGCAMLIEGFEGAYKFEEIGQTGRYKETVEKNAWSHVMNALEYVVGATYAGSQKGETKYRQRGRPVGRAGY